MAKLGSEGRKRDFCFLFFGFVNSRFRESIWCRGLSQAFLKRSRLLGMFAVEGQGLGLLFGV